MVAVSIIMPIYNGEKYLRESIESILKQDFDNFELIIVNDCSTDNSLLIAEEYEKKDSRITIINNAKNEKLPEALNIGFRQAKGKYFTWTSDDNIYSSDAIKTMHSFLENNKECGLVYCGMHFINENGEIIGSMSKQETELYYRDCVGACFMYRADVVQMIGEYNPQKFLVEDYDYWLRISEKYPICHINEYKYYYRVHKGSLTGTRADKINEQLYNLRKEKLSFMLKKINEDEKKYLFIDMWAQCSDEALIKVFFNEGYLPEDLKWVRREKTMDKNKKYILFGAGDFGKKAVEFLGRERIEFYADNNIEKVGTNVDGIEVISFEKMMKIHDKYNIVITVDSRKSGILANQLIENNINVFETYMELTNNLKRPSMNNVNWIEAFKKASNWIEKNTIDNKGIINNTKLPKPYPEVTGYYIPTLMKWGYRDLAVTYAKWLCSIQKEDGSWYDTEDKEPYVFDSGQILKGLLSVRKLIPEVDENIKRGCEWIIKNMEEDGRLTTPSKDLWDEKVCSELIHLYCLSPLIEAGNVFNIERYKECAKKIAEYYVKNFKEDILEFNILSHFYAYIMEALCDIGMEDIAKEAMSKVADLQREDGMVPAYKDVNWVCSTGLFQFAIVWYKLGDLERGNKAISYATSLQNESGGWYGSYPLIDNPRSIDKEEYPNYFETSEISWAVKYFLDAVYYKCKLEFEKQSSIFFENIDEDDGRYQTILNELVKSNAKKICDVGCGKGRYIKKLTKDIKNIDIYAVDLSEKVMSKIDAAKDKKQGSLTCIPYKDETFDVTYSVEALEHSIATENAVKEMLRVTKRNGKVIIIDKNKSSMGLLEIDEWEQWFDDMLFEKIAVETNCKLEIISNIPYEDNIEDNLFNCWILKK